MVSKSMNHPMHGQLQNAWANQVTIGNASTYGSNTVTVGIATGGTVGTVGIATGGIVTPTTTTYPIASYPIVSCPNVNPWVTDHTFVMTDEMNPLDLKEGIRPGDLLWKEGTALISTYMTCMSTSPMQMTSPIMFVAESRFVYLGVVCSFMSNIEQHAFLADDGRIVYSGGLPGNLRWRVALKCLMREVGDG